MDVCKDAKAHPGTWVAYTRNDNGEGDRYFHCPLCDALSRTAELTQERDRFAERAESYRNDIDKLREIIGTFEIPLPIEVRMKKRIENGQKG